VKTNPFAADCLLPTSRKEREKWGTQFVFSAVVPTKPVILSAEMWATRPALT
jgi:hypothetical protein